MKKRNKQIIALGLVGVIVLIGVFFVIYPGMIDGWQEGCPIETAPPGEFTLYQPESPDSDGIINLDWSDSARVCHYNVYRHIVGVGDELIANSKYFGDVSSYTVTEISNGNYFYRIEAYNKYGSSGNTGRTLSEDYVIVKVELAEPAPDTPTLNLILENPSYDGNFDFNWWATTGAISYNVYRSLNGETYYLLKSGITGTGLIGSSDSGLSSGNYWYKVTAVNNVGESGYSNPQGVVVTIPATPNEKPIATIDSIDPMVATWGEDIISFKGSGTDTDGTISAYQWLLDGDEVLDNSDIFEKPASAFGVGDITIYFRVQDNDGDWSDKVSKVITIEREEDVNIPDKPTLGSIDPLIDTDGDITLNWNDVDGATYYNIYRSKDGGTFGRIASDIIITESTYLDEDLNDGEYCYKIKAGNNVGISDFSIEKCVTVEITVEPTPPDAPVLDKLTEDDYSVDINNVVTVQFNWDEPKGAVKYNLYRSFNGSDYGNPIKSDLIVSNYKDTISGDGTYVYKVTAISDNGLVSEDSNTATVEIKGSDVEIPEDYTGVIIILIVAIIGGTAVILVIRNLGKKLSKKVR